MKETSTSNLQQINLTETQREVMRLAFVEGLTAQEIADTLGLEVKDVSLVLLKLRFNCVKPTEVQLIQEAVTHLTKALELLSKVIRK
jgi:DNA-binding NarL/FixJ family response regulator